MSLDLDSTSRFRQTQPINKDGKVTFGLWVRPDALKKENMTQDQIRKFNVTQETAGRPDLISYKAYGTPYLDWVIIMHNRPINTLNWPKAGTQIEVPVKSVVLGKVI